MSKTRVKFGKRNGKPSSAHVSFCEAVAHELKRKRDRIDDWMYTEDRNDIDFLLAATSLTALAIAAIVVAFLAAPGR